MKLIVEFIDGELKTRELFNIAQDPSESNNIIEKHPESAKSLLKKLTLWEDDVQAERLSDFRK